MTLSRATHAALEQKPLNSMPVFHKGHIRQYSFIFPVSYIIILQPSNVWKLFLNNYVPLDLSGNAWIHFSSLEKDLRMFINT